MGYTTDWENIMNNAFGKGGRPNFGTSADDGLSSTLDAMTRALQDQQKELDARIQAQTRAIKESDDATQRALHESRQMLKQMENDGLLAKGTSQVAPEHQGSFLGLADAIKEKVLGQDAFVDSLVRAMRRPFVLGTEGEAAKNVILICGSEGTGRHYALRCVAQEMAARGLIRSDKPAMMDLALYNDPGDEKLFLQDLYAALHAPGEMLLFEHYEQCHPSFLNLLADLAIHGSAQLNSRYLVKDGILVDAGTALAPGTVGNLTPRGKYMILFSPKGREKLADKFGAGMVAAVGDVCQTGAYTAESLQKLAAQSLNKLAQKVNTRLNLKLRAGVDVRDWVAARHNKSEGAGALASICDQMFRALSEYCLDQDTALTGQVTLTIQDNTPYFSIENAPARPLLELLPTEYTGALEAVQQEMDRIVGLTELKQYVMDLADNVRVQQRRAEAGLPTSDITMHMIFSGNPGTGKTTIARLLARYLKAIGALSGGQLVEVSRADLVGRYSGHTAPLTNSVIQSALGGVLFIDEAYSLYRGEQDSFGLEAIDTLVKGMEDHRNDLVVVLAGYTREMNEFLTANSGLASRFPNQLEFPDYTGEELLAITKIQAKAKGYAIDPAAEPALLKYYTAQQAENADTAGNGRLARNTLEKAILNQSRRIASDMNASLEMLLPSDFSLGESVQ